MKTPFFQCITEFIFLENEPEKADVIFIPGGNYPEAARRAADLYRDGFAPLLLPSGRYSVLKDMSRNGNTWLRFLPLREFPGRRF